MPVISWNHPPYDSNNIDTIKILVWNIITAKIFLDPFFEKYYHNFLNNDSSFNMDVFTNSIWEVGKKFTGNNYKIRYTNFEKYIGVISLILRGNEHILKELKESIIWDLEAILWENLTTEIENFKNITTITRVKNGIHTFVEKEFQILQELVMTAKLNNIRNDFIDKIAQVLKKRAQ